MKIAQDIIIAPVITEKSMSGIADKKYTFKVASDANKIEIANAVEQLFKVKVAKVNTINVRGKMRRMGRYSGYTSSWKNKSDCGCAYNFNSTERGLRLSL